MPWRVSVPYDRNSPYEFCDSTEAARFIVQCDEYQENYDYDESAYQETINECYASENRSSKVVINGNEFWPDEVLKEMNEESYWDGYNEERRYYASESYDNIEDELNRNEYDGGVTFFDGNIRCEYYEESEEDDDDEYDEGHDQDKVFDCFSIAT